MNQSAGLVDCAVRAQATFSFSSMRWTEDYTKTVKLLVVGIILTTIGSVLIDNQDAIASRVYGTAIGNVTLTHCNLENNEVKCTISMTYVVDGQNYTYKPEIKTSTKIKYRHKDPGTQATESEFDDAKAIQLYGSFALGPGIAMLLIAILFILT